MNKTAIFIVNYNMPERTDRICEHIMFTVNHPYDLYVIDNGSDLVKPSQYTTIQVKENRQTVGGWLAGVDAATHSGEDYSTYWFIITSMVFNDIDWSDPLDHLLPLFKYPDTFAVHPATTFNHSAWEHWMSPREPGNGRSSRRRTWGTDYIAVLMDAEKYHKLDGFNPRLTMGWGVMGEMNWKARRRGWKLYINDTYVIHKETDIGYDLNRMNMNAEDRKVLAAKQSDDVLSPSYGEDYRERFRYEYTELVTKGDY